MEHPPADDTVLVLHLPCVLPLSFEQCTQLLRKREDAPFPVLGRYAFPSDDTRKYELLLDIDSLLFEVNAAADLIRSFFVLLHKHVGRPIAKKAVGKKLQEILAAAGQDTRWFRQLDNHRNFFIHNGTPYIAVDLTRTDDDIYDLLIMKETLRDFRDTAKFLRLSDLGLIVRRFATMKPALQEHLIGLFK